MVLPGVKVATPSSAPMAVVAIAVNSWGITTRLVSVAILQTPFGCGTLCRLHNLPMGSRGNGHAPRNAVGKVMV